MATTGAAAWQKYYQGKGDVETVIRKPTPVLTDDKKSTGKTLPLGTPVVVLKTAAYNPQTRVKLVDGNVIYVKFDDIAKPGKKSSSALSLKPQAFNIKDKNYSPQEYISTVTAAIEDHPDLDARLRSFLLALFTYHSTPSKASEAKKAVEKLYSDELPINDINKDFAEVIGPIASIKYKLMEPKGIKFSSSAKIFVPSRPNEPLMDYAIVDGTTTYTISAKSGTTTNVVKPADILMLLGKNKAAVAKWKSSKEYNVLWQLANANILVGPIAALASVKYMGLGPAAVKEAEKVAAAYGDGTKFDLKPFAGFIAKNQYLKLKKKPTMNEIMYECEKAIQTLSKTTLDFSALFKDAIKNSVIYIKYEMTKNNPVGSWSVIVSKDIAARSVYLRTKNGYTRRSDRMGIQV